MLLFQWTKAVDLTSFYISLQEDTDTVSKKGDREGS